MDHCYIATITNACDLPINVETWQSAGFYGFLDVMKTIMLKKGESTTMTSSTGEWHIDNYIFDKAMCEEWTKAGCNPGTEIGKFCANPSFNGETVWMYNDKFQIEYNNGVATFSKKE